jgi:transcriptional regulator with XRE-family HTH domain
MGRPAGAPEPIASYSRLVDQGLSRVRAHLAVQLGTLRSARSLTYAQLAGRASVNPVQVSGIEKGTRNPHFETVVRLANALDLGALDELLGPMPLKAMRVEER